MPKDSKFESIFVYPTDGEAFLELRRGAECFAVIKVASGELVVDFFGEAKDVPAGWIKSQIEMALARAKDEQGKLRGFKMQL